MPLDDQYEFGRIPLKPLPYKNKELASCNEFIIDYGEDASYHMYISDSNDPEILIDLTAKIIKEIFPNAEVNANQFQITIEGIDDPISLQDILNFIYKRFTYPENINGFVYKRDIDKVLDPTTKSVLLQNTDGTILLPITTADNVYDSSGKSLQDRLNNITRLGFSMTYVTATTDNQTEFDFSYPFENYSDFMEVRIGTVYVDKTRYYVVNDTDADGNYTSAKLIFVNNGTFREAIENGRRIDILFIFNSVAKSDGEYEYMSGANIANATIPTIKLERTSDLYTLNDPTSVATSAAVYNLYSDMIDIISNISDNIIWAIDSNTSSMLITLKTDKADEIISNSSPIVNISLSTDKKSTTKFNIVDNTNTEKITYTMKYPNGTILSKGIPANKTIRLLLDSNNKIAFILSNGLNNIKTSRSVHTCIDQETIISYDTLNYNTGDIINVYRNGVRLFEDIDYSMDIVHEKINLFVRTEEGERIIFEVLSN